MTDPPIDFPRINAAALANLHPILARWLPDGRLSWHEYTAKNPTREDRRAGSFRINLTTGRWADFATGDKGGDLVAPAGAGGVAAVYRAPCPSRAPSEGRPFVTFPSACLAAMLRPVLAPADLGRPWQPWNDTRVLLGGIIALTLLLGWGLFHAGRHIEPPLPPEA